MWRELFDLCAFLIAGLAIAYGSVLLPDWIEQWWRNRK